MSKNRIKSTAPLLKTRAEMEAAVGRIREIVIERNRQINLRDTQHREIDEAFAEDLASSEHDLLRHTESVRAWAEANPAEFGGKKSLETSHGTIGWRLGQHALKTLSGWTLDRVLEKLKSLKNLAQYVRVKEEVDKQAIIADRDGLGPDMLRTIGLRVVQAEPFFIEPKVEEPVNKQTSISA